MKDSRGGEWTWCSNSFFVETFFKETYNNPGRDFFKNLNEKMNGWVKYIIIFCWQYSFDVTWYWLISQKQLQAYIQAYSIGQTKVKSYTHWFLEADKLKKTSGILQFEVSYTHAYFQLKNCCSQTYTHRQTNFYTHRHTQIVSLFFSNRQTG